jgi:uncharacterized protein YndB with AHSA1/START domain
MQPPPLRISRVLHARRETVFKAWSSGEHVKRWFGPEGVVVPDAQVDFRVGGRFDVCMQAPNGEHWTRGTFVEVTPHSRLVIDMRPADAAGHAFFRAYTEVDFFDDLGGTRMEVVQTYTLLDPAMAAPMVAGAPEGWRMTLDKLEKVVIALQSPAEPGVRSVVHATFHLERTYDAPAHRVWRALTDEAAKRHGAAEGALGGRHGLVLRRDLPRGDPERAAGLQLRDAHERQQDLDLVGDHAAEGQGGEDHPDGHRTGRLPRRLRRRRLPRARHGPAA